MSEKIMKHTFKGRVGGFPNTQFGRVQGIVEGVSISNLSEKGKGFVCRASAKPTGQTSNGYSVSFWYCGTDGDPYHTEADIWVSYRPIGPGEYDSGGEGVVESKEITVHMETETNERIEKEIADVGGRVLGAVIVGIKGHPGARFDVEILGERGIRCTGGFLVEENDHGKLVADVTVSLGLEP